MIELDILYFIIAIVFGYFGYMFCYIIDKFKLEKYKYNFIKDINCKIALFNLNIIEYDDNEFMIVPINDFFVFNKEMVKEYTELKEKFINNLEKDDNDK